MKKLLLLFLLFLAFPVFAQQAAQRGPLVAIQNPPGGGNYGKVGANAEIYICVYNTSNTCVTPLTVYSNVGLTTSLSYPFPADQNGVYSYYIQAGTQLLEKICFNAAQCQTYPVFVGSSNGGGGGTVGPGTVPNIPVFNQTNTITTAIGLYGSYNGAPLNWPDPGLGFGEVNNLGLVLNAANSSQDSATATTSNGLLEMTWQSVGGGAYGSSNLAVKSNRSPLWIGAQYLTVAQNFGLLLNQNFYSGADSIGIAVQQGCFGGYVSEGQEPCEAYRAQQSQAPSGAADGNGGLWAAPVTNISGTTVSFGTPTNQPSTLSETRFIRDLSTKITGTYTNVTCTGSPVTCTVTGSGFSALANYSPGATYTTYYNAASGGPILINKAIFCPAPAALSVYDGCIAILSIASDTSMTMIPMMAGTQQNTGWPWATSGNYSMYTSTYPTAVNQTALTANGLPPQSFSAADVSGIGSGHNVDQVLTYSSDEEMMVLLQSKNDFSRTYGGGIDLVNFSATSASAYLYGLAVSGNYQCALCIDPSTQSGKVQNSIETNSRPTGIANFWDFAPASTTPWNFWSVSHLSDGTSRSMIHVDPNVADPRNMQFMNNVAAIDLSGNGTFNGGVTAGGVISGPYISSGPYNSASLDSKLATIATTTYWTTFHPSGCTGSPNGFATLTGNSATGPFDSGSQTTAPTITLPASFGGTGGCTYLGLKQSTSMTNGNQYTLLAWVQSTNTSNVAIGFGDSTCSTCAVIETGAGTNLTKGAFFFATGTYATSTNAIYVQLTALSATYNIYVLLVPGGPGPFLGTTTSLLSGNGLVVNSTVIPLGSETVASSTTPTFSTAYQQSYNVLTANISSFTLPAGYDGQPKTLVFCQNGTGGYTVAAPANVHGFFTVGATASKCSTQSFSYSVAQTAWVATSAGVTNE